MHWGLPPIGGKVSTAFSTSRITATAYTAPPPTANTDLKLGRHPGTNLAILLQQCGIHVKTGCGCEEWINKMNTWGPQGCYEHRQEIVDRLKDRAKTVSVARIVYTGLLMMWKGMRPTVGELVDEAIWRAEDAIANGG